MANGPFEARFQLVRSGAQREDQAESSEHSVCTVTPSLLHHLSSSLYASEPIVDVFTAEFLLTFTWPFSQALDCKCQPQDC
jgi:hypothetical protein